jgi:hypothetical protein
MPPTPTSGAPLAIGAAVALALAAGAPWGSGGAANQDPRPRIEDAYRFVVYHDSAEATVSARAYLRKTGALVGHAGMLRSYAHGECRDQVQQMIGRLGDRLPPGADRRLPEVAVSRIEEAHRGQGLAVVLYKLVIGRWFSLYGPSLVGPNMCSYRGATTTEAQRVWASLCRDLPCAYPVIAVLEPIPGLERFTVKYAEASRRS